MFFGGGRLREGGGLIGYIGQGGVLCVLGCGGVVVRWERGQ